MSCYICDDSTFNRVTKIIIENTNEKIDGQKLVQALYKMNKDAYIERYGEDTLSSDSCPTFSYHVSVGNTIQQIKTISCFLYQCSEGKVMETDLYAKIANLRNKLAMSYIYTLPAYDMAEYG